MPSFSILSISWLIIVCIVGLQGQYRCLIGWSVFRRIRCWTLSVGPVIISNFCSSWFRNTLNRWFSLAVWRDNPTECASVLVLWTVWLRGGFNVSPIFAYKSTPISIGIFNAGITRNLCENFLFPTEIDSLIAPGTFVDELFATELVVNLSQSALSHLGVNEKKFGSRVDQRVIWPLSKHQRYVRPQLVHYRWLGGEPRHPLRSQWRFPRMGSNLWLAPCPCRTESKTSLAISCNRPKYGLFVYISNSIPLSNMLQPSWIRAWLFFRFAVSIVAFRWSRTQKRSGHQGCNIV